MADERNERIDRASEATAQRGEHRTLIDPVELAFALWDDDCAIYASVNGVSIEEAAVRLEAARGLGRTSLAGSASGD